MALTPVLTIPVDVGEFDKFVAAFQDWREKVKEMPADWVETNKKIAEAAALQKALGVSSDRAWSNATTTAMNYERAVARASAAQANLGRTTTSAGAAMKRMAHEAKSVATSIFGAVRSMTKWATFGLGGGLLGLGGLTFGLDRLAGNVLERQRTAQGLGLTVGQYNSFRVNMQRYAGQNVLQGAANAQIDQRQWGYLAALGINGLTASRESATDLAGQEIMAIHRAWLANPTLLSAQAQSAMQLGFTAEDIRRIGLAKGANLQAAIAATARDSSSLGFSAQVAAAWSKFKIQLDKAGTLIETALINTLTPLTPQLTRLSKELADFIVGLEKSGQVKEWVADLADAIKRFANWLGSPSFQQDMKTFAHDFHIVAEAVYKVAKGVVGLVGNSEKLAHGKPASFMLGAKNNPGNVMIPGTHTIAQYSTLSQGISAAYKDLSGMPTTYGATTVGAALAKYKGPWAGPGDMTTQQYVDFVTKTAGISPNAPLPVGNTKAMERIMYGLFEAEGWPTTMGEIRTAIEPRPGVRPAISRPVPPSTSIAPPHPVAAHPPGQRVTDLEDKWTRVYAERLTSNLPSNRPARSDIGLVRDRYWATHAGVRVKVQNSTGAQVHVSSNAAAAP